MTVIMSESESNNSNSSEDNSSDEFKAESSLHSGSGKPKLSGNEILRPFLGENSFGATFNIFWLSYGRGNYLKYFPTVVIATLDQLDHTIGSLSLFL